MKKICLLLILGTLLILPKLSYTQKLNYDESFKYRNVLSNVSIRAFISGSQELNSGKLKDFGFGIGVIKPISDHVYLRGQGEINGILNNGFDRYGKVLYGASFGWNPLYIFGQTGFVFNPSDKYSKIGAAINGGIGLSFKYFFVEAAVDRVSHGTKWTSDVTVYAGCNIPLGIMPSDANNQKLDKEVRSNYGNLIQENRNLKSEVSHQEILIKQCQDIANKNDSLFRLLNARLNACESENRELKLSSINVGSSLYEPIYFDFGSCDISPNQDRNIANIARYIIENPGVYTITGYSSNVGGDYSNLKLSENRAWSVYYRLLEFGVDEDYLVPSGVGKTEIFSEFDEHSNQCVIVKKSSY